MTIYDPPKGTANGVIRVRRVEKRAGLVRWQWTPLVLRRRLKRHADIVAYFKKVEAR